MKQSSIKSGIFLITYGIVLYLSLSHHRGVSPGHYRRGHGIYHQPADAPDGNQVAGGALAAQSPAGAWKAWYLHCAFHTGRSCHYHRSVRIHSAAGG